jgi:DNA processing protein
MLSSASALAQSLLHWLALSCTTGLGPTRGRRLVAHFGGVNSVFRASLTELEASGIPAAAAQSLALGASVKLAEEELDKAAKANVQILCPDSPNYPQRLLEIYDPPLILYVQGNVEALSAPGIAVVGTRHPTPYGLGMAERLSCDLATRGLIIISGMARGVDSASHRGAIAARGRTVGVFGTGVDVVYPRENKKLAEQVLALDGALISEFPMGTAPTPQNFPIRNRVISGLSQGVLVVEAGEYSGTRITARCALEQSRDVFAVPGNVTNKLSWGPNTLIKQGAKLVATWEDIWEEMPSQIRLQLSPTESKDPGTASLFEGTDSETTQQPVTAASGAVAGRGYSTTVQPPDLQPHERKLIALIKADQAIHIDELVEKLDGYLSSSEIFSALFELELANRIKQLPGKNYVRTF